MQLHLITPNVSAFTVVEMKSAKVFAQRLPSCAIYLKDLLLFVYHYPSLQSNLLKDRESTNID